VIGGFEVAAIPFGTVPYAVKANYAATAQDAMRANLAAQAYYTHRITATAIQQRRMS